VLIAVVDAGRREKIAAALARTFEVEQAADFEAVQRLVRESSADVLLLDLSLPPNGLRDCLALLEDMEHGSGGTLTIVLSDDNRKATALRVMDAGAYDYFVQPVDPDVLRTIVDRAVEKLHIERDNRILREALHRKDAVGDLLGSTDAMRALYDSIRRVANSSSTVVIRGESGSGKELVARAIHDLSQRRDRPFVSVNCAALPETLMEAELFGYERGAFTGAVTTKEGRIELAQRGTLFLDEIGTLSPALQSKLLRVLEERTMTRLGGRRTIKVDFRLLTATNEALEELVQKGRFREDLYYRIHVVPLYVPPLRERLDDIPLLANYFVKVYCASNHLPPKKIDDEAMLALKRYPWPGNVRELENVVQRIVLMTDEPLITVRNIPADVLQAGGRDRAGRNHFRLPSSGVLLEDEVAKFERQWIEAALAQAKGVKSEAAQLLGVNRDRMKYLCRKYRL
jgi:DNA-binding NtrC family response regulator